MEEKKRMSITYDNVEYIPCIILYRRADAEPLSNRYYMNQWLAMNCEVGGPYEYKAATGVSAIYALCHLDDAIVEELPVSQGDTTQEDAGGADE